jgi:hypothetical protein
VSESRPTAPKGTLDKSAASARKQDFQKVATQGNPALQDATSLQSSGLAASSAGAGALGGTSAGAQWVRLLAETSALNADADPYKDCMKTSGESEDADKDGWSKNLTTTYACDFSEGSEADAGTTASTNTAEALGAFKLSGSMAMIDADDTKPYPQAGVSFSWNTLRFALGGLKVDAASAGAGADADTGTGAGSGATLSIDITVDGSVKITGDARELKGASNFKTSIKAGDKEARTVQWIDSVAKPTDPTSPEKGGTVSFSGFLQVVDVQGQESALKVSTSGLTYDASCPKSLGGYKSGTITYEAASGKAQYVFAECEGTLKFDGQAL